MLEDKEIGYLDPGIEDLLEAFFKKEGLYTTSSCIGRITILHGIQPWDRNSTSIIFKKHGKITVETILEYLEDASYENLWLRVTGPILHVICKNEEWAQWIIDLARKSGFKHSCIFSLKDEIVVEIMSSIQITIPLKADNTLLVCKDKLSDIASLVNSLWEKGVASAESLKKMVEASPDPSSAS
jgi:tRNA wybutosine-synthesizing protein 3